MSISDKRKFEIFELSLRGEASTEQEAEIFLESCDDPHELHYFAEQYNWDGDIEPIKLIIENERVDAGTLLYLYWYGCPEYYFQNNKTSAKLKGEEKDIFELLTKIETQFLEGSYGSRVISFDPSYQVSMRDKHPSFIRPIPEALLQSIG